MTVEVDLGEAIEEIEDDALLQEVHDRKLSSSPARPFGRGHGDTGPPAKAKMEQRKGM